jgi:hypothetical protein
VGEQSNAYRILLRYDRKSRHRRIKKQRRYERLAATSQFLSTARAGSAGDARPPEGWHHAAGPGQPTSGRTNTPYVGSASRRGVARTLSRCATHNLASVEQPSYAGGGGRRVQRAPLTAALTAMPVPAPAREDGLLRITSIAWDFYPRPPSPLRKSLGFPSAWYPAPDKASPHPVVLPNVPGPAGLGLPRAVGVAVTRRARATNTTRGRSPWPSCLWAD